MSKRSLLFQHAADSLKGYVAAMFTILTAKTAATAAQTEAREVGRAGLAIGAAVDLAAFMESEEYLNAPEGEKRDKKVTDFRSDWNAPLLSALTVGVDDKTATRRKRVGASVMAQIWRVCQSPYTRDYFVAWQSGRYDEKVSVYSGVREVAKGEAEERKAAVAALPQSEKFAAFIAAEMKDVPEANKATAFAAIRDAMLAALEEAEKGITAPVAQ